MAYAQKLFKGRGVVYINGVDTGNCDAISLGITSNKTSVKNYRKPNGGDVYSKEIIDSVECTISALDWSLENFETMLRATNSNVATSTVASEAWTITAGDIGKLKYLNNIVAITAITVDTVAGVEGVDYELTHAGFIPLVDGAFSVSYTVAAQTNIEALTTNPGEAEIVVILENEFDASEVRVVKMHKVSLSPLATLDLLAEDTSKFEIKGTLVADTSKTTGLSQYFQMKVKKA